MSEQSHEDLRGTTMKCALSVAHDVESKEREEPGGDDHCTIVAWQRWEYLNGIGRVNEHNPILLNT
jgi:hypothetical protein